MYPNTQQGIQAGPDTAQTRSQRLGLRDVIAQRRLKGRWKDLQLGDIVHSGRVSKANLPTLWADARKIVQNELPPEANDLIAKTNPEQLVAIIREKEDECDAKKLQYKRKDGSVVYIAEILNKIIVEVRTWTKTIDIVASYDPGHIALPWAFVQVLLQFGENISNAFASLVDGLEVITGLMVRYEVIERQHVHLSSHPNQDLKLCLVRLYTDILRYLINAYYYFGLGRFRRAKAAAFPKSGKTPEDLLKKVMTSEAEVQKVVASLALSMVTDIHRQNVNEMELVRSMNTQLDILSAALTPSIAKEEQMRQLDSWLKPINTADTFQKAFKACQPGTSTWILTREAYCDWSQNKASSKHQPRILWVQGPPGFGKTVLCAQVLHTIQTDRSSESKPLALFFCTSEHKDRQDTTSILRSWLGQLIHAEDKFLKIAFEFYTSNITKASTEVELWQVLQLLASKLSCTLVVDGLDECVRSGSRHDEHDDSRSQFLDTMIDCLKHTDTQILVSSRGYDSIKSVLYSRRDASDIVLFEQPVTQKETVQDVLAYAKALLEKKLPDAANDIRDNLAQNSAGKSEGMFLYINLLGRGMRKGDTVYTVRQVISEMPAGLDTVYEEELKRILEGSSKKQALAVFRWLLFAVRPLTLRELAEALALTFNANTQRYPREALPAHWEACFVDENWVDATILRHCGSFVELRKTNDDDALDKQTVHFPHASIREFLLQALQDKQGSEIGLQDRDLEIDNLALLCLRYLCYDVFSEEDKFRAKHFIRRYPFIFYATASWYDRVKSLKSISVAIQTGLEKLLDPDTENWVLWSEIFEGNIIPDDGKQDVGGSTVAGSKQKEDDEDLTIAKDEWDDAGYADSDVESLHDIKPEVQAKSEDAAIEHSTISLPGRPQPIYYAALLGLINLVRSFQARGMNCEGFGGRYGTPLQAAVFGGHDEIVEFLLESGAEINAVSGCYGTAISAASAQGNATLAHKLLERGADPSLTDNDGYNALHYACKEGNLDIAKLLLEQNKGLVTSKTNKGDLPIALAIPSGQMELVRLLHRAGADINSRSQYGSPLLHMAIDYGHQEMVKYLIKHRADIEARDHLQNTALLCAAWNGNYNVFRLLIAHKADVKALGQDGLTLLHRALGGLSMDIFKAVIALGPDVNASTTNALSPIHIAAKYWVSEAVQILIDKGANVNVFTDDYYTPLMLACQSSRVEAAKILIQNHADLQAIGIFGDTAFDYAMNTHHKELLEVMLAGGSLKVVESSDNIVFGESDAEHKITPLKVYQSMNNNSEQTLLADIDSHISKGTLSQADKNSTLLVATSLKSHLLVKELLERGAEASCKNLLGKTPLHIAVRRQQDEVLDLLLSHGAKWHVKDNRGCAPIHVATEQGIPALNTITKLLKFDVLFDSSFTNEDLQPNDQTIKDFSGIFKGSFSFGTWDLGKIGQTTVKINFSRTPEIYHKLPWFIHEAEEDAEKVITIGIAYQDGKGIFLRLNAEDGWYCEGQLEHDSDENGEFFAIRGNWGECEEQWHGTMDLRKIGDIVD